MVARLVVAFLAAAAAAACAEAAAARCEEAAPARDAPGSAWPPAVDVAYLVEVPRAPLNRSLWEAVRGGLPFGGAAAGGEGRARPAVRHRVLLYGRGPDYMLSLWPLMPAFDADEAAAAEALDAVPAAVEALQAWRDGAGVRAPGARTAAAAIEAALRFPGWREEGDGPDGVPGLREPLDWDADVRTLRHLAVVGGLGGDGDGSVGAAEKSKKRKRRKKKKKQQKRGGGRSDLDAAQLAATAGALQSVPGVASAVVVTPDDDEWRAMFGDARRSDTYLDGSSFGAGVTLHRALFAGGDEASSLQATSLAAGTTVQLVRASLLARRGGALLAATFEPRRLAGITLPLCDACRGECDEASGTCEAAAACPAGEACSPSRGCVPEAEQAAPAALPDDGEAYVPPERDEAAARAAEDAEAAAAAADPLARPPALLYAPGAPGSRSMASQAGEAVEVLHWSGERDGGDGRDRLLPRLVRLRRPVVVRGATGGWPALQAGGEREWTWDRLAREAGPLEGVKRAAGPRRVFYDPDGGTPMAAAGLVKPARTYRLENMTSEEFVAAVRDDDNGSGGGGGGARRELAYHFGGVPDSLRADLLPNEFMFLTDADRETFSQYLWLASGGVDMHTHFDQDHNVFVQLVGRKRFTLFPPSQHARMHLFPRIHPLWHKSQCDFDAPDTRALPGCAEARGLVADLAPGDVLYVPPYWWHHVQSRDASVSLSTWSEDTNVYEQMDAIYRFEHKFDLLRRPAGRALALRAYLELLLRELRGPGGASAFARQLLRTRYAAMGGVFPAAADEERVCGAGGGGAAVAVPRHVYSDAQVDAGIVGEHFMRLVPETRDILLEDYVEEIVSQVVGTPRVYAFLAHCFGGRSVRVLEPGHDDGGVFDPR